MSWTKIGLIATQKPMGHCQCMNSSSDAAALRNCFAGEFDIENMFLQIGASGLYMIQLLNSLSQKWLLLFCHYFAHTNEVL